MQKAVSSKKEQFNNYNQHDSSEFLTAIMEIFQRNLVDEMGKENQTFPQELTKEAIEESWKIVKKNEDSIVTDLFYSHVASIRTCKKCKKVINLLLLMNFVYTFNRHLSLSRLLI